MVHRTVLPIVFSLEWSTLSDSVQHCYTQQKLSTIWSAKHCSRKLAWRTKSFLSFHFIVSGNERLCLSRTINFTTYTGNVSTRHCLIQPRLPYCRLNSFAVWTKYATFKRLKHSDIIFRNWPHTRRDHRQLWLFCFVRFYCVQDSFERTVYVS